MVNSPAAFNISLGVTNKKTTVSWSPIVGSTYSIYSAANINGPWNNEAYGLTYYPTNGTFSEAFSSNTPAKYFQITSP